MSARIGRLTVGGIFALAMLVVAGCAHNTETGGAPPVTTAAVVETKVDALAALLPDSVKRSGRLVIGVNLPNPPTEFRDSDGRIVGFDIDLMNAVSQLLGVRPDYTDATFEKIIPAVAAGTYDLGVSSFTDTLERQKTVDFTDYFRAGFEWAQQTSRAPIDPDHACGLRVAVQATTEEDTNELPAKSAACVAAGKPPIVKVAFPDQTAATTALIFGQVDAMTADSPVTEYAVKQSSGRLRTTGPIYNAAYYGWPVAKGSTLAEALRQAAQHLIDNGDYRKISAAWGLQSGDIDKSVINGAQQ